MASKFGLFLTHRKTINEYDLKFQSKYICNIAVVPNHVPGVPKLNTFACPLYQTHLIQPCKATWRQACNHSL